MGNLDGGSDSGTEEAMALVRVRERAQITLPQEVRDALKVKRGDYLEAEIVAGGVLLRPKAVVDRDGGDDADARARLRALLAAGGTRWAGPGPEPSEDALLRDVAGSIEDDRRARREGGP
jgi:AbrB family looped-hinge helix DNA binding protein